MRGFLLLSAIFLSSLLGGCAVDSGNIHIGGTEIVTSNEIEIIFRYGPFSQFGGIDKVVKTKAQEHCKQFEKLARFHEKDIRMGDTVIVIYRCE